MRLWALGQLHTPEQDHTDAPDGTSSANSTANSTAQALAQFGLVAEDPLPEQSGYRKCYLWPEHVPVYQLWQACQTQWRDGMGGRTGLDYPGVQCVMRTRFGLRGKPAQEQFGQLQAMEITALNAWAEQKDK